MIWRTCLLLVAACLLAVGCRAKDEPVSVTCGSVIKLEHDRTNHYLHSHEVAYGTGRGSGQQSVTGYPERESGSSMWIVRSAEGHCVQGTKVTNGAVIRLQHGATRKWLHSHLFYSPLSNNQEVSCFGDETNSDTGDWWHIEWDGKGDKWQRDMPIRLKHKDTGAYLASHNVKYERPIPGQTEVHALKTKSVATVWKATEGVYFPEQRHD